MRYLFRPSLTALILTLVVNFQTSRSTAQNLVKRDSFLHLVKTLPEDTNKVILYIKFSSFYTGINVDSALYYAEKAGAIARKYGNIVKYHGYKKKLADIYFNNGNYADAIEAYKECIAISAHLKDSSRLGKRYLDLAGTEDRS